MGAPSRFESRRAQTREPVRTAAILGFERLDQTASLEPGDRAVENAWARQLTGHRLDVDHDRERAYRLAAERLANLMEWCFGDGVSAISVYLLSRDNLKRDREDLRAILAQIEFFYGEAIPTLTARWQAKVVHAGRLDLLPFDGEARIRSVFGDGARPDAPRTIYLCLAYHPLDELQRALSLAGGPSGLWQHLWVPDTLDLVVRTGGDTSLSNFLPLQAGYARIFTINKPFPDIERPDLGAAVDWFRDLPRRQGV